jgi:hypothetical protein
LLSSSIRPKANDLRMSCDVPAYKTASSHMGPVEVGAPTFVLATLILVPFLPKERTRRNPGAIRRQSTTRDWIGFMVIGIFGLVPASAFLAWGTERSTASNAALIYLTVPILTAVPASVFLGERKSTSKLHAPGFGKPGGKAFGCLLDITDHEAYAALVTRVAETEGRIATFVTTRCR